MHIFVLVAGVMGVALFVAGLRRPRVAVFVAAILWLLYAYYETLIVNGTLCDANCNIRVDLVFFFPILGLATFCAHRAYTGRPIPWKVIGVVVGIIGLFVFGLVVEGYGYKTLGSAVFVLGALAIGIYAFKSRSKTNPS